MRLKHPHLPAAAAFVGLATGLAISTSWSDTDLRQNLPTVSQLTSAVEVDIDPLRAITRAEMRLVAEKARGELADGRPWAAWRTLEPFVTDGDDAEPAVVLLAARAAGEWGGWSQVRSLLRGARWLDRQSDGEGWMLLGRAEEKAGNEEAAAEAYRRRAATAAGAERATALARLGAVLRRGGDHAGAAKAYAAAAEQAPEGRDWMRALQAEALLRARDPRAAAVPAFTGASSAAARERLARAAAASWTARGDTARALARLDDEARALDAVGGPHVAALRLERARLLLATGRGAEARELLRRVAADSGAGRDERLRAAARLGGLSGRSAADEEARAAAYEAGGKPGLAARALRAAIAAGAPDAPETRLRVGRLLFEERDLGPARANLKDAAERLGDREQAAEAELLAARALFRQDPGAGLAAFRKLAEQRAGTAAAGSALFLLGDAAGNVDQAIALYRQAAAVPASPYAREALFRAGDRSQRRRDPVAAARFWEEYAARYPRGEETAHAAYLAGVIHERAGRAERARGMYQAAIAADPVSYYAVRAADRLGANPLEVALAEPRPWIGDTSDPADAATALRRLDVLEAAGLDAEWKTELAEQLRRLDTRPVALLSLAEGLRDRNHAVEAIRLGRRLADKRGQRWDGRLLRVVFPFPYRDLLRAEAERADVDPYLLAGLVRQESSYDPHARSRVGATGLSQIMPSTGEWLARGAGVREFHPSLLAVPEINLRMGARYLGDQLDRYRGARDLALAAYNAGPGRADRWKRELGYGRDVDAFRERIPFDETREYVKLVLRNAAVYKRLYGGPRSGGLVTGGD